MRKKFTFLVVFYLPRHLSKLIGGVAAILSIIHLIFEPNQHSWYTIVLGFVALLVILSGFGFSYVKSKQLFKKWQNYRWWVNFHIYAVFAAWVTVLFHSGFRLDSDFYLIFTFVSLIVFASGVTGQYFFIKIPRTSSGLEESRAEIIEASENHAIALLKVALHDKTLFNFLDNMDHYIRETTFHPKRNLSGLIANDIRMGKIKRKFLRDVDSTWKDNPHVDEYKALIFKRMTIELKIAHMSVAKKLLKRWTYFHIGAIYVYILLILWHVYVKLVTTPFTDLVFWNWK